MNYKIAAVCGVLCIAAIAEAELDTNQIEQITGLKGTWSAAEGVFKVSAPRSDLAVKVDEWTMPPFMGLTSWAAFKAGTKENAMVMGDLVLFQDEVNPVMSVLFENGVEVTALHNHFFYENPKVFFMHIGGEGDLEKLAQGVKAALTKTKELRESSARTDKSATRRPPAMNSISVQPLQQIFSVTPQVKDGMAKFVFGRVAKMSCGCEVGKEMGVNTWAAFAGKDDDAVVDGDFACQEDELQPVLRSLRKSDIEIVAIHQHMTHEQPRYVFLHYWGRGQAADLANAVKRARGEQTKVAAAAARAEGGFKEIDAADYEKRRAKKNSVVLDVRSSEEFAKGHVPGAVNIDVNAPDFAQKVAQFDKSKTMLVNCHAGSRGAIASAELAKLGFKTVCNLDGGLDAWEKSGNKSEATASQ